MKFLVTGGCGYIGSLAVKKLLKNQHEVIIVDDLSTGNLEAINGLNVIFEECDIRNYELLDAVFKKYDIDFVMDFAAKLVVEQGQENPELYYDVNVNGLKNVLDAMVNNNVKKIIFSSTAAVYGLLDKGNSLICEDDSTVPSNTYGNTKLIGELMVKDYSLRYGLDFLIFRYFNVVGNVKYGEKLENITTIVPVIINAINNNKYLTVNGDDYETRDGSTIRDFIHIEDLVDAHIIGANNLNAKNSGIYNLSIGTGTTILELIELSSKELNKEINFIVGDRRQGDPVVSAASNDKFMNSFDWKINYTDIGMMIKETFYAWEEYNGK